MNDGDDFKHDDIRLAREMAREPGVQSRMNFGLWIEDKRTVTGDFERKDIPAATHVNDQFIVGGEKGCRSCGQPKDRP